MKRSLFFFHLRLPIAHAVRHHSELGNGDLLSPHVHGAAIATQADCGFAFVCYFNTTLTSDATLTIGNTPKDTVRKKGAGHGSPEDTRVSHCNSVQRLSFGSTQLAPCVCFGWLCHRGSPYSHRGAHRTAVSTQLRSCTFVGTHQTMRRQVGTQ